MGKHKDVNNPNLFKYKSKYLGKWVYFDIKNTENEYVRFYGYINDVDFECGLVEVHLTSLGEQRFDPLTPKVSYAPFEFVTIVDDEYAMSEQDVMSLVDLSLELKNEEMFRVYSYVYKKIIEVKNKVLS